MGISFKRAAASVTLGAMLLALFPSQTSAATTPSATTIFKQSFANLDKAASYDMSGRLGIVLPESLLAEAAPGNEVQPLLVNGNELRAYFTSSFNKNSKEYQIIATSYNAKTGESPRVEMIGNKDGVLNMRLGGFTLPTSTSPEVSMIAKYLNTWIRIDRTSLPSSLANPLMMPMLGTNTTVSPGVAIDRSILSSTAGNQTQFSAADQKKLEEMDLKIKTAFWKRNVMNVRRLSDAKDSTGAPAYHLGLTLNSIGARLFALDVAKITGTSPSAADLKEFNKIFSTLPAFSGDVIVNKTTMIPELLAIKVSGFQKNKQDDVTVALRVSFEHIGSGRTVTMPTEYTRFEDIIAALTHPTIVDPMFVSSTLSTAYPACMAQGNCPSIPDPTYEVIYGTSTASILNEQQARNFIVGQGVCAKQATLRSTLGYYNPTSKTWWFDMENTTTPMCSPACALSETTMTSEINPRCTGAL